VAGEEANDSSCKAVALCADVDVAKSEGIVAVVEEAMLKMAEVDIVVVRLLCRWSYRRIRGAMVMTETRPSWERGDAKVGAVRAVVDIEERRRHNRGKRSGNGRVDAEVDTVKPPKR
jgi:hypothetical protein